jgi:hypothetical protein
MISWWLLKKGSVCDIMILASSPKSMGLDCKLMVSGRSMIYMRKSRGLSIEPKVHVSVHFILCVCWFYFYLLLPVTTVWVIPFSSYTYNSIRNYVGFGVLTAVIKKKANRRFGATRRIPLRGRRISQALLATRFHAGFLTYSLTVKVRHVPLKRR